MSFYPLSWISPYFEKSRKLTQNSARLLMKFMKFRILMQKRKKNIMNYVNKVDIWSKLY